MGPLGFQGEPGEDAPIIIPPYVNPEGWAVITKPVNQDVTGAGATTNDNDFFFTVAAGGHYAILAELIVSGSNVTGDYGMDFTVSAGTMTGKGTCQNLTSAAAIQNIIVTAAAAASTTSIVTGAPSASIDDLVYITVRYAFTASAAATLRFRFGNGTATIGAVSRTWKGSVFKYKNLD
jgi:hypothetical protein